METPELIAFVAFGLLSPILGWLAHLVIDKAKVHKAHKRLDDEPLVFEGSRFRRLLCTAGSTLMGPGMIAELELGRVMVVSDEGDRMTFSGQEFEAMHPVWTWTDQDLAEGADELPAPARRKEKPFS